MGHYQPRYTLVTSDTRKADLLIRDPSTLHKHKAEKRIKELEDKRKKQNFCGKLVKAYNEEQINHNKAEAREMRHK